MPESYGISWLPLPYHTLHLPKSTLPSAVDRGPKALTQSINLPYHTLPNHTLSYHILPYHTLYYQILPYLTPTKFFPAIPYHNLPQLYTLPYPIPTIYLTPTIPYPYHTLPFPCNILTLPYHSLPQPYPTPTIPYSYLSTLPYHVLPLTYHTIPYNTPPLPFHTLPYPTILYRTIPYP